MIRDLVAGIGTATSMQLPESEPLPRPRSRRMYAGARINRLSADWLAGQTSADAEIKLSIRQLRNRARQMVRDNPYARQAKRAVELNVIGTGVQLQARVMKLRGGMRDDVINQRIETLWLQWCRKESCDAAGRNDLQRLARIAVGAMVESGEAIFRVVNRRDRRGKVPMALQMIESDMLDEEYAGPTSQSNSEWRLGVEIDEWGQPLNYAFFTRHPGDSNLVGRVDDNRRHLIIPASEVIHLFEPDRPGQTRGVPWFSAVMDDAHQMAGYEEAAVVRARGAASLMGFIQSPDGELEGDDVEGEDRVTDFEPGQFRYLNPGETVQVPQLQAPDAQYEMFVRQKTRRFAAGMGCSYETVSKDFSQTNYSSSRLSLIEDRDHWKVIQDLMIQDFYQRIYVQWLQTAVLGNVLQLGDYEIRPERYEDAAYWQPRGWQWVDPLKEAQAYALMEDRGYITKSQVCGMLGTDLEENMRQKAFEQQLALNLGVTLADTPAAVNNLPVDTASQENGSSGTA